jgi:hypothetical protein
MLTRRVCVFVYTVVVDSGFRWSTVAKGAEMVSASSNGSVNAPNATAELESEARSQAFAQAIDALQKELEADLGERDVEHLRRVMAFSKGVEWFGRACSTSASNRSVTWGVTALWLHKTLELMEIGHTVLHGTYDHIPCAQAYRAGSFHWKAPIDEAHGVRYQTASWSRTLRAVLHSLRTLSSPAASVVAELA